MKTKITFLAALCFLAISNVWATPIEVKTVSDFTSALTSYVSGDTLLIFEGTYDLSSGSRAITKDITIMADPAASSKPKVKAQWTLGGNCSFAMEGIEAYYDIDKTTNTSAYFFQAVAGTYSMTSFSLKDCYIHGYGRALLRADNTTNIPTITNIVVNNCVIADMGRSSVGYSVFAVKTGKISNASIINTTVYDSPNGFWYTEVTAFPISFNMENCCLIKTTGAGSKLLFNANTNAGSTYTLKNSIISDSYDATTTNMALKLSAHTNNIDNVVFGNNMATPKFISTTLATDIQTQTTTFSYNYPALTITTDPITINNLGDTRWRINGVWTSASAKSESNIFANLTNNQLTIGNLPLNSTVVVYSFAGSRLFSKKNSGSILQLPVNSSCIVKVTTEKETVSLKVIK